MCNFWIIYLAVILLIVCGVHDLFIYWRCCLYCFRCPYTFYITRVVIFFETMLASSPGHVRRCLLFINFLKYGLDWKKICSMKLSKQFSFIFVSEDDEIWSLCLCNFLKLLFYAIVILIVIYQYIHCSKFLNICCWRLLCEWWYLTSHGENLLYFILRSFYIKTCIGCCFSVIVGFYTRFVVGMGWNNNAPQDITVITLPFYHHFFVLYFLNLMFVE